MRKKIKKYKSGDDLLDYLMRHPKATDEEISKNIGLSRSGVAKKRKRLEEKGEIEYFVTPNLGKAYRKLITGLIKFSPAVSFKEVAECARKFASKKWIISAWIRKVSEDSWGMGFMAMRNKEFKSQLEYDETISELKKDLKEVGPDVVGWDISCPTYVVKMFGRNFSGKHWE